MEKDFNAVFKSILLKTMKAFDAFCDQHNIEYFAAYGTLIGAIRHKGLIPWDDDIDVFMDWENYTRFLNLRNEALKINYKIIDRHDVGYYLPFAKFVDTSTTIWECKIYPFIIGVYIDVFPLGFANNIVNAKNMHAKYVDYSIRLKKSVKQYDLSYATVRHFIGHPIDVFCEYHEGYHYQKNQNVLDKFDSEITQIKTGDYRIYYGSMGDFDRALFKSEWFNGLLRVPYEDFTIPVPIGYHNCLETEYGDYMTPPSKDKQVSHHTRYYCNLRENMSIEQVKERIKMGEHLVY